MALNTIGSIATHIAESFVLPAGVSGNLVETVDIARIDVQNFVGTQIDPNDILEIHQSPIVNFSKAQALNEAFAFAATVGTSGNSLILSNGGSSNKLKLGELEVTNEAKAETEALKAISTMSKDVPAQFREMAMNGLKSIGRKMRFGRSVS